MRVQKNQDNRLVLEALESDSEDSLGHTPYEDDGTVSPSE